MQLEILKPKGHAFCRTCCPCYPDSKSRDKWSLRGKKALKIDTYTAQGHGISFYCMKHAQEIKNKLIDLLDNTKYDFKE